MRILHAKLFVLIREGNLLKVLNDIPQHSCLHLLIRAHVRYLQHIECDVYAQGVEHVALAELLQVQDLEHVGSKREGVSLPLNLLGWQVSCVEELQQGLELVTGEFRDGDGAVFWRSLAYV